jgi:HSP20 family molecular chaperone IbpA
MTRQQSKQLEEELIFGFLKEVLNFTEGEINKCDKKNCSPKECGYKCKKQKTDRPTPRVNNGGFKKNIYFDVTNSVYKIDLCLPGVDVETLNVEVNEKDKVIRVEQELEKGSKEDIEIKKIFTEFNIPEPRITLKTPDDADLASVSVKDLKNGIVRITIPKEQKEVKKVKIV